MDDIPLPVSIQSDRFLDKLRVFAKKTIWHFQLKKLYQLEKKGIH